MSAQRIILINCSRLLGDMLQTVIHKANHLKMVQKVNSYETLPTAIEMSEAEWVILSLPSDKNIPDWVDQYIVRHPSMRFLTIFLGNNRVTFKGLEYEEDLEDMSLDDLIHVLENHPQRA